MAHLASRWLAHYPADVICLVSGVSSFYQFADVFRQTTGKRVIQAAHPPLLVTHLGIAMHTASEKGKRWTRNDSHTCSIP